MSGRRTRPVAGLRVSDRTALLLIGSGAAVAGAMAFLGAPLPPPVVPTVAHLSGMWAGYGVAVMLLLMARVPALERGVGADRLARWHAVGGRTILLLVLLHGLTATLGWMQAQGSDPVSATIQVLGMPWLLAATAATAIFCAVGIVSIRSARKRLSYETWHALHLSTYLAVALSFAHEPAGPNLAGHRVAQIWWSLLCTAAFALVVRFRFIEPLLHAARHRMRVDRVVQEGPAVVSLHIRGRHLDELGASPLPDRPRRPRTGDAASCARLLASQRHAPRSSAPAFPRVAPSTRSPRSDLVNRRGTGTARSRASSAGPPPISDGESAHHRSPVHNSLLMRESASRPGRGRRSRRLDRERPAHTGGSASKGAAQ